MTSNDSPYPHTLIDTPPEFIQELAIGLEPVYDIARRYGYTITEYDSLAMQGWFRKAVADAREVLDSSGWDIRHKAAMMAESLLVHTFHAAKVSDSVQNKLDVAKYLAKIGDLEPKPNQIVQGVGEGFNIIINIPNYTKAVEKSVEHEITIEGSALQTIDDPLPAKPSYIRLPVYTDDMSENLDAEDSE